MQNVNVMYQFNGLQEPLEESIKKYVLLNLYVNPEAEDLLLKPYYKRIFTNKPDAKLDISVQVARNKFDRFDGVAYLDGDRLAGNFIPDYGFVSAFARCN